MDIEEIEHKVRVTIASLSDVPEDGDANADLYLDFGMPSVQALVLLQELEERFAVAIPDDEFVQATTIRKLTITLDTLLNPRV